MRFLVDAMLGNVARDLRLLGYDAAYAGSARDAAVLRQCQRETRILITRDRELARRAGDLPCVLVHAAAAPEQTPEVLRAMGAPLPRDPLSRCLECNGPLRPISPREAGPSLPDHVATDRSTFLACKGCGRVYWEGSHGRGLRARLRRLQNPPPPSSPGPGSPGAEAPCRIERSDDPEETG